MTTIVEKEVKIEVKVQAVAKDTFETIKASVVQRYEEIHVAGATIKNPELKAATSAVELHWALGVAFWRLDAEDPHSLPILQFRRRLRNAAHLDIEGKLQS